LNHAKQWADRCQDRHRLSATENGGWLVSWPWRERRRRQGRDEDFIWRYQFPEVIEERCRHHNPDLSHEEWKLVEQGLREWFLCCAWRDGEVLGMPSRTVDEAWHEFILDSRAYTEFCEQAFGEYLHHTPEASMTTPMAGALDATARAWERSSMGHAGGSLLWGLDVLLGRADPKAIGEGRPEGLPAHWREPAGGGWGSAAAEVEHHHSGGGEGGSESGGGEGFGVDSGGGGGGGDSGGGGGDSGGGGCGGGGGE
jgi:hypothetical protein